MQMKNIKPFAPALAPAISSFTQPVETNHELKFVDFEEMRIRWHVYNIASGKETSLIIKDGGYSITIIKEQLLRPKSRPALQVVETQISGANRSIDLFG